MSYTGKNSYYYYKKIGVCPYCKKNEPYNGLVACLECRVRLNSYRRSNIAKDRGNIRSKERRDRLRNAGICYYCGKRKISEGKKTCYVCRKKRTIKRNNKRVRNELENICNICGKNMRLDNKRVCEPCYKILIKRVEIMNTARGTNDWIDHPWKRVTFNV